MRLLFISHFILCLFLVFMVSKIYAAAPKLQTPAPVIYLEDNLDEEDELGWCIDTLGRGYSEQIHVHSCKPHGGDVQFSYDLDSLQLKSAEFLGKCVTLHDETHPNVPLSLEDCVAEKEQQKFAYDKGVMEFHPIFDRTLCLSAGVKSRKAGPFMSRDLLVTVCETTEPSLKRWVNKAH